MQLLYPLCPAVISSVSWCTVVHVPNPRHVSLPFDQFPILFPNSQPFFLHFILLIPGMSATEKTTMESDVHHTNDAEDGDGTKHQAEHASWRALFNFTSKAHTFPLSLALVLSVVSGIVIPALAVFLGKVFDLFTQYGAGELSGPDLVHRVSRYGLYLVGLGCASGVLNAFYFMLWLVFGELQAKAVREKLFDGMLEKEMEWYDMRKAGIDTLISRLQA